MFLWGSANHIYENFLTVYVTAMYDKSSAGDLNLWLVGNGVH